MISTQVLDIAIQAQRVSIALCTLNGGPFLQAQLDSYLAQRRLPDELVACDDGSTDNTLAILDEFAQRSPFPVRILRNPRRLGVVANFEQAIGLCKGDVIALSDQDDVWLPEKLACLMRELQAPETMAVFSDATVVDASLQPLGYTLWQRVQFRQPERMAVADGDGFPVLLRHSVVMGASLAFRAELRAAILPIPPEWNHDAWIALIATNAGRLAMCETPLLSYRQHGANQVGAAKQSPLHQGLEARKVDRRHYYDTELQLWASLLERLTLLGESVPQPLLGKIAHLQVRANLPASRVRRIPGIWRELVGGAYARYARNWGSVALDLFIK
jgi:hypothetical protein